MQVIKNKSQEEIVKKVLSAVREAAKSGGPINHILIVGSMGSGKTFTLRRLFEEVQSSEILLKLFNPVFLPFTSDGEKVGQMVERTIVGSDLTNSTKRHILFIDDLHLILQGSDEDAHEIRKLATDSNRFAIIATGDRMLRNQFTHNKPFYGFFRILELQNLVDLNEVDSAIKSSVGSKKWDQINAELSYANPHWLHSITGGSMWLLKMLQTSATLEDDISTERLLSSYYDVSNVYFQFLLERVPKLGRYLLEGASLQGEEFMTKHIDLGSSNVSHEVKRLIEKGYLHSPRKGKYAFTQPHLKAWLRYRKRLPFGDVVSDSRVV